MTGQYGSINIGLFRCTRESAVQKTEEFWCKKEQMLFFGVAFLQLDNPANYLTLSGRIEREVSGEEGKICHIITYCTYDNADLVLLISGNSLRMIEQQLQEIDSMPEVRYQHSVLGVSEHYLDDCKASKKILDCWQEKRCFIEEPVFRLDIRLVSSGEMQIANIEKNILDKIKEDYTIKNYEKATYSYVTGHENLVLSLADTDVRTMLFFCCQAGLLHTRMKVIRKEWILIKNKSSPGCLILRPLTFWIEMR